MTDHLTEALKGIRERAETADPYAEQLDTGYPTPGEATVLRSQADVPAMLAALEAVASEVKSLANSADVEYHVRNDDNAGSVYQECYLRLTGVLKEHLGGGDE